LIRALLSLLLFLYTIQVKAQAITQERNIAKITQVAVLPDHNYSFDYIRSAKIPFVVTDSVKKAQAYWIRAVVNNQLGDAQNYYISIAPNISTKFYHIDPSINQWMHHQSTITQGRYRLGVFTYQLERRTIDTVYFWVDLRLHSIVNNQFKLNLKLDVKEDADDLKQEIKMAWLVCMTVLFLVFLNYLYIYIGLRDKPVLFYVLMQLGGMIYLTAYWRFFALFASKVFSFRLGHSFHIYDVDQLLMHLGIVLIFYSYVQLTRSYLNTKENLPIADRILKYCLWIYIIASAAIAGVSLLGFDLEYYTLLYDNGYCGLLILIILYTTIKAYLLKTPLSKVYLYSNLMQFSLMLSIPLYHLLIANYNTFNFWLPVSLVIYQALGFSIALVTRTKTIQETLNLRELESKELEFNLREIGYQNKLNEMQLVKVNADMQLEKNRNELLQGRLELQQRELASSALHMVQKSELLAFLKDQLQKLNWLDRYHTKRNLHELNQLLESNIQLDSDWSKFKIHFEQVHPDFFQELKRDYPSLTQKEIRLHTYFQMKLSHKEIAALLAIDPASVRRAKTRLYKKMGIAVGKDLPSE
jgi:hypothetical protein